jgi:hypothetical protein
MLKPSKRDISKQDIQKTYDYDLLFIGWEIHVDVVIV